MVKCILDKQYNKCPHLGENQQCMDKDTQCGMREKEKEAPSTLEGYVRQKRWYEDLKNR